MKSRLEGKVWVLFPHDKAEDKVVKKSSGRPDGNWKSTETIDGRDSVGGRRTGSVDPDSSDGGASLVLHNDLSQWALTVISCFDLDLIFSQKMQKDVG